MKIRVNNNYIEILSWITNKERVKYSIQNEGLPIVIHIYNICLITKYLYTHTHSFLFPSFITLLRYAVAHKHIL